MDPSGGHRTCTGVEATAAIPLRPLQTPAQDLQQELNRAHQMGLDTSNHLSNKASADLHNALSYYDQRSQGLATAQITLEALTRLHDYSLSSSWTGTEARPRFDPAALHSVRTTLLYIVEHHRTH